MTGLPILAWIPKPFGAGDTDGAGARRALGQPNVSPQALLVREMAQNSWDARLPDRPEPPLFEMRLRTLSGTVRDTLRWNVFAGGWSPTLGLGGVLGGEVLLAAEIADRGTRGLGGPLRNDVPPTEGEPTDYADFILTVGAPPDQASGGGTYGFGKTAAYAASACSTIVVWTRTKTSDGRLEDRFIASAMGASFELSERLYTGRQWWGVRAGGGREPGLSPKVEPLVGESARTLGEQVFVRHFAPGETGTSILVLQPKGFEDPVTLASDWARAVGKNLWPKLDRQQPTARQMDIRVLHEDVSIPLADPASSPALRAATQSLAAVRASNEATGTPDLPLTKVYDIRSQRPKRLLGHLAVTRYTGESDNDGPGDDCIIYMRDSAELVVREESREAAPDGVTRWIAVFKPVPELDPVFAAAEPPAHDAWNPEGLDSATDRTCVRVALRNVRAQVQASLRPHEVARSGDEANPTGALSIALAGLVGSTNEGSVGAARSSQRGRRTSRIPKVDIIEVLPVAPSEAVANSGRQVTRLALSVSNADGPVVVHPSSLSVAVDGGSLDAEGQIHLTHWTLEDGSVVVQEHVTLQTGQSVYADLSYPDGLAVDVRFAAKAV